MEIVDSLTIVLPSLEVRIENVRVHPPKATFSFSFGGKSMLLSRGPEFFFSVSFFLPEIIQLIKDGSDFDSSATGGVTQDFAVKLNNSACRVSSQALLDGLVVLAFSVDRVPRIAWRSSSAPNLAANWTMVETNIEELEDAATQISGLYLRLVGE